MIYTDYKRYLEALETKLLTIRDTAVKEANVADDTDYKAIITAGRHLIDSVYALAYDIESFQAQRRLDESGAKLHDFRSRICECGGELGETSNGDEIVDKCYDCNRVWPI